MEPGRESTLRKIIGVDPGVRGSYSVLWENGNLYGCAVFPLIEEVKKNHRRGQKSKTRIERSYDREAMIHYLSGIKNGDRENIDIICYMELVHSRPGEGSATSFKFGDCFGQLKMLMTCMNIPIRFVSPNEWCPAMHVVKDRSISAKERSWLTFEREFPELAVKYAKRPPDGIIDATLIAEFGRRRIVDGMDEWRFQ